MSDYGLGESGCNIWLGGGAEGELSPSSQRISVPPWYPPPEPASHNIGMTGARPGSASFRPLTAGQGRVRVQIPATCRTRSNRPLRHAPRRCGARTCQPRPVPLSFRGAVNQPQSHGWLPQ